MLPVFKPTIKEVGVVITAERVENIALYPAVPVGYTQASTVKSPVPKAKSLLFGIVK